MPKPTIGKIVHYVVLDYRQQPSDEIGVPPRLVCFAAIVTKVFSSKNVQLSVFSDADHGAQSVFAAHSEEKLKGTWHWPEREEKENEQ